jgi:hypothetical protein
MTLGEARSLVNRIAGLLATPSPAIDGFQQAEAYARVCNLAARRLAQIANMIEEGSSLQALMLAEEPPALLDLVAILNFAKRNEWITFCQENGLPVPAQLDKNATNALNNLYSSGSKGDQTKALYRDFRGAMAKKDEARALEIIRTIARLDPADTDAAQQLNRLENKAKDAAVSSLNLAIAGNSEEAILQWLAHCESLEVAECETLGKAREVRRLNEARGADLVIKELVSQLPEMHNKAFWHQAGEKASRVRSLAATHGITLSAEDNAAVTQALTYFELCRAESMRKARFKEALNALSEGVERMQADQLTEKSKPLPELEERRQELRRLYEVAGGFDSAIPETTTQKVSELASAFDAEILRLRNAHKMRNTMLMVAAALMLAAVGWLGFTLLRAHQIAGQVAELRQREVAIPLERLVADVRERHALKLNVPSLSVAVLEAEQWLASVATQKNVASNSLEQAKTLAANDFAETTAEQASTIFRRTAEELARLPSDVADSLRPDFVEAEKKLALWLPQQRDARTIRVRKIMSEIAPLAERLSPSEPPEVLEETLAQAKPMIDDLQPQLEIQVTEVALPAALHSEVQALLAKVQATEKLLSEFRAAQRNLVQATDLGSYAAALQAMAAVGLPKAQAVQDAQRAATWRLNDHSLLGQLLLPDAPEVWSLIKSPGELESLPYPDAPREVEVDRLVKLIKEPDIAEVHEARVASPQAVAEMRFESGRLIFTRGKLSEEDDFNDGYKEKIWSGAVYEPSKSPSAVEFAETRFVYGINSATSEARGEYVSGTKRASAGKALEDMRLGELVSSSGDGFRQSIFPLLDRIRSMRDVPPFVRAYVFQEMLGIAQLRASAWGLTWAPALQADSSELRETTAGPVKAGDWMIPRRAALADTIEAIFKSSSTVSYETQGKLHRKLAAIALEGGLAYCGHVDGEGEIHIEQLSPPLEFATLWGFGADEGKMQPLFRRGDGGQFVAVGEAASLTPLLAVRSVSRETVEEAMRMVGIPPNSFEAYKAYLPPLFRDTISTPASNDN